MTLGIVLQVGLLLGLDLKDSLHVILMVELRSPATQRYHARLHAHSFGLGSVEVVGAAGQLLVVDVGADVHLTGVNLHDAGPGLLVRHGELDLPVEATRAEQGWVQDVHPVGGSNHLHRTREWLM